VPEVVAEHQVSEPEPRGLGQEERGERPPLEGRGFGQSGGVEMVVEPQGVEAELLGGSGSEQHVVVGEGDLRDVDAEVNGVRRGRGRGWGWRRGWGWGWGSGWGWGHGPARLVGDGEEPPGRRRTGCDRCDP
jgi:hypothetical protein